MSKKSKDPGRFARSGVQGEHPYGDIGQFICLLVFLAVWILDSFVFHFSIVLSSSLSFLVQGLIALPIIVASVYLVLSGHRAISDEVQAAPRVLKDGAFAYVRHLLYLAGLLFYILLLVFNLSLLSFAVFAGIVIFYNFIAASEEKGMEQRFGREYADYKAAVGRWFPKLFARKSQ